MDEFHKILTVFVFACLLHLETTAQFPFKKLLLFLFPFNSYGSVGAVGILMLLSQSTAYPPTTGLLLKLWRKALYRPERDCIKDHGSLELLGAIFAPNGEPA